MHILYVVYHINFKSYNHLVMFMLILEGGLFITWSNIIVEAEHSLISSILGNFKGYSRPFNQNTNHSFAYFCAGINHLIFPGVSTLTSN